MLAAWLGGAVSPALADGDRLTVHGYLTQAYAESGDLQVLGAPTDGTTDYRTMALQFRYAITDRDAVVIQLSHERAGDSPFDQLRDDVELDWAFYEHSFEMGTSVRVGRVPIPFGIYNELRDVGTVLEFYRPPTGIYFEGGFSNESVDGIVLSHRFDGTWALTTDLYYGGWTRNDSSLPIRPEEVSEGTVTDALGAQLWLETPLEGLRFGLAAQTWTLTEGLERLRSPGGDDADVLLASVDLDRDLWYARGEWQRIETSLVFIEELTYEAWYLQAGLRLGRWGAHVLYEDSSLEAPPLSPVDPWYDDLAFGVTYAFSPATVGKLEYHDIETALGEGFPEGPTAGDTDLLIASFSVSF